MDPMTYGATIVRMTRSDYLTVAAMIVLITPIVVTVMVATGIPGVTPRPPRNANVTGQGTQAGQ